MPTSMPTVVEELTPVETSPSAELLAESARIPVDHLTQSVQRLRHLHLALDEDPSDVEARRVLGAEFESAGRALAVAQSFETSISELADGPVTAIDAIASSLPALNSPTEDTRHVAAELIASLARNAIDRLDIAHPALGRPDGTGSR